MTMASDSTVDRPNPRAASTSWLRPVCERLIAALDRVRGDRDRDSLAARAALRQAVSAYVGALRAEGISAPWVLESVVAFARGCRPRRTALRSPDPVEADIVRWSLVALEWPQMMRGLKQGSAAR
jgi:hypothetical protein